MVQSYSPCGVNVPPMRAHWCHLANAFESVLPSAHPSPHPKWQMNRFSHFCTAHGSVSSGMPRHVLSPNNCPFASAIWLHLMHASLGPLEPKQHHDRFGRFCTVQIRVSSGMSRHVLPTQNCPFPWGSVPHLICGFLGPLDLASKMAPRAVQPFLDSSWQKVPVHRGRPFPPKLPLCMRRIWTPSIHDSLGPSKPITQTASQSVQPQSSLV